MSALSTPETIDLTDSGDEGAGSPLRPRSHPRSSSAKRKTPLTNDNEDRPLKKSRTRTVSPRSSVTELDVADALAGAVVGNSSATINANATRNKALYDLKELSPRYHTTYSTEFKNPEKFSIKPAFYIRWKAHDYINLAEHMRYQFNPIPFAREADKPVQEVDLIAARLVFNPLYDASEAMKRGEEGMKQILATFKKSATPSRVWADKTVKGELDGIKTGGSLRLVLKDGSLKYLTFDELDATDTKYLDRTLSKGDWMLFYGRDEEAHDEMTSKVEEAAKNKAKEAKQTRPKKDGVEETKKNGKEVV